MYMFKLLGFRVLYPSLQGSRVRVRYLGFRIDIQDFRVQVRDLGLGIQDWGYSLMPLGFQGYSPLLSGFLGLGLFTDAFRVLGLFTPTFRVFGVRVIHLCLSGLGLFALHLGFQGQVQGFRVRALGLGLFELSNFQTFKL